MKKKFSINFFNTVYILTLTLFVFSCNSTKNTPATQNLSQNQKQEAVTIIYERTPCYGTCPSYVAEISAAGKVKYNGRGNVKRTGEFEMQLPKTTVDHILEEADKMDFFKLQDEYKGFSTDIPASILTITKNGQTKRIYFEDEVAPASLVSLASYIQQQLDSRIITDPTRQEEKVNMKMEE